MATYTHRSGEELSVADEPALAVPSESDDFSELDQLLADYHQQTTTPTQPPEPDTSSPELTAYANGGTVDNSQQYAQQNYTNQELVRTVDQIAMERAMEKADRDLKATVAEVRGDFDAGIYNDEFVQTWVDNQARQRADLRGVWMNRERDPASFARAVNQLQYQFAKTFPRYAPDRNATEDREAVVAAVTRGSTRAPVEPPPSYGRLSNAEYRKSIKDAFGFDPI